MENRGNLVRPVKMNAAGPAAYVVNKQQLKPEIIDEQSDDEAQHSNESFLAPVVASLNKLRKKVTSGRNAIVMEKMECNSAKLLEYSSRLKDSTKIWEDKAIPEDDKLTFRSQKVLSNFTSEGGAEGRDEASAAAANIIFGNNHAKTNLRPVKLAPQQNVPPYTTWIYLDRNQRMTEDQSVQGRRRIYYDPVGNETLIASDSEEEEVEEEEPKHDFSKGEDYLIWMAVQECGASDIVFGQIAHHIDVNREEVQARYELILHDVDKQARCDAHGKGISTKEIISPSGRRKLTRDHSRVVKEIQTQTGLDAESSHKNGGNRQSVKTEDEKFEAKDLVAAMDSFDNLFCRRCLVFDCRLHGCSQPLVHPSERQMPLSNPDTDTPKPCSRYCYLLPQVSQVRAVNSCISAITDSKIDESSPAEGEDKARIAKRQKIQEGEMRWSGEEQVFGSSKIYRTIEGSLCEGETESMVEKVAGVANSNETNVAFIVEGKKGPIMHEHVDASGFPVMRQNPVTNRVTVTSAKKLARIARRSIAVDPALVKSGQGKASGAVAEEDNSGASTSARRAGKVLEVLECQEVQVETDLIQTEVVVSKEEKTRVTSAKKLARIARRGAEGKVLGSSQYEPLQTPGKPTILGSAVEETLKPDSTDKKLGRSELKAGSEKATGSFESHDYEPPVIAVDPSHNEEILKDERTRLTSAKKLARRPRNQGVQAQQPQIQVHTPGGDIQESQQPKEEKSRNSAARKLARSARKVLAQKVAGAIQQHQLQMQMEPGDVVSQKDLSKQGSMSAEVTRLQSFDADAPVVINSVKDGVQALLSKGDEASGLESLKTSKKRRYATRDADDKNIGPPLVMEPLETNDLAEGIITEVQDGGLGANLNDKWTALEKGLYEKGLQVFGKNSCLIAKNMLKGCKTCTEVADYIVAQEAAAALRGVEAGLHQFPDSLACGGSWDVQRARARFYGRRKGSRKLKFTLKSAGQSAIRKRMVNGKDMPCRQYTPCGCLFTCGKQCPCQLNGTCCEKYCGCAKSCKNRFRGCHCAKSQCCSRQCPCFAAGRECDPDVCRNCWIGCGDGNLVGPTQKEDKEHYECHNMKLLLKQQQRVLLSRSDVAGWGAFLKNTVSKHEYLGEYTGELISHREADKRGKIYDRENSSFLFNLNDQYVLDACRKGDKLKFANHSPNPNCYAKVIMVAGDHRVGIFAKERILAGEELFYDYRYEADRAPSWAKKGEDSGNGKRDDNGASSGRAKQAS